MSNAMGLETQKAVKYSKVWNLPNILTYGRIVAVPVVTVPEGGYPPKSFKEEWTLPPDSKALAVSEYFGLLEQNRLLQNTPPQTPRPN